MNRSAILSLAALAGLWLTAPAAHAATIFADNFDGGTGGLNGTAPDVTTGANWVAASVFKANGEFTQPGDLAGSATLSFTPANGLVYTLDASVSGVSGGGDWIALGFANGQATGTTASDRFITGNVVGTAWMLLKGDAAPTQNSAFLGLGTFGTGNHGLTSNVAWSTFTNITDPGEFDLRIVLDTTGGSGNWTSTWYAKPSAAGSYSEIRPTAAVLDESNFTSVGFALAGGEVDGSIESFSLSSEVPEPSAAVLLGLGGLALLRRRRR